MSSRRVSRSVIVLFSALFLAVPLLAAERVPGASRMSDIEILAQFDAASIIQYRRIFEDILTMDAEMIAASGQTAIAEATTRRIDVIRKLSDADIARLMAAGIDLTELHQQTAGLHERVFEPRHRQPASDSAGLPDASYSFCGDSRRTSEGMFAGQVVLDTAKAVWAGLSRLCDEVIVIAGFGGNLSIPCIAADIILYAAEAVYNGFAFCDADIDSAEIAGSYLRLDHLHTDLDGARTGIINNDNSNRNSIVNNDNTNTSTLVTTSNNNTTFIVANDNSNTNSILANDDGNTNSIVTNDNANRDAIIANDDANRVKIVQLVTAGAELDLRIAIEQNLEADEGNQLAVFILPAAHGGYLEVALALVDDLIGDMSAATERIYEARKWHDAAVLEYSAGNFKLAYKNLQASYRELAKW